MRIGGNMLRTRFTTRGDHRRFRDTFYAFGSIPRLHGAVMRLISLVLLATAAFGQTYTASTFAGVWLPENLPGAVDGYQVNFRVPPGTGAGTATLQISSA